MDSPNIPRTPRRAVVLFIRDEGAEAAAKPLPGRFRSRGYSSINRSIAGRIGTLCGDGIDLVIAREGRASIASGTPVTQRGDGFGERIANAMADVFALGYDQAAIIGNDCLTITPADILAAFGLLDGGASVVAAPARDGGAYLIAARNGGLDIDSFRDLPWCTANLFAALTALPAAAALPILRDDFDRWDLPRAIRSLEIFLASRPTQAAVALPAIPIFSFASHKALSRIYLPAPPDKV